MKGGTQYMSYTEKRHDKAKKRKNDEKHIKRKENIIKNVYDASFGTFHYDKDSTYNAYTYNGEQIHRLSKNKIHCSCPMCTEKTKNIGWKHGDKVKFDKYDVNEQIKDIENNDWSEDQNNG